MRRRSEVVAKPLGGVEATGGSSPSSIAGRRGTLDGVPRRSAAPPRKAVLVLVADGLASDRFVRRLAASLEELGVETVNLGREERPEQIAAVVVHERADAVELCFARERGVLLLRQLLRELIRVGRRDVCIVVHRVL